MRALFIERFQNRNLVSGTKGFIALIAAISLGFSTSAVAITADDIEIDGFTPEPLTDLEQYPLSDTYGYVFDVQGDPVFSINTLGELSYHQFDSQTETLIEADYLNNFVETNGALSTYLETDYGFLVATQKQNQAEVDLWEFDTTALTFTPLEADIPMVNFGLRAIMGDVIYLAGSTDTFGYELYFYNLVTKDFDITADITPGSSGSSLSDVMVVDDRLFFVSASSYENWELYEFIPDTGSGKSTIQRTPGNENKVYWSTPFHANSSIIFEADTANFGEELYEYKLSDNSVTMLIDNVVGPGDGGGDVHGEVGGKFFITLTDDNDDDQVYYYDPSLTAPNHIVKIDGASPSNYVFTGTPGNGKFYIDYNRFSAKDQLWSYDVQSDTAEFMVESTSDYRDFFQILTATNAGPIISMKIGSEANGLHLIRDSDKSVLTLHSEIRGTEGLSSPDTPIQFENSFAVEEATVTDGFNDKLYWFPSLTDPAVGIAEPVSGLFFFGPDFVEAHEGLYMADVTFGNGLFFGDKTGNVIDVNSQISIDITNVLGLSSMGELVYVFGSENLGDVEKLYVFDSPTNLLETIDLSVSSPISSASDITAYDGNFYSWMETDSNIGFELHKIHPITGEVSLVFDANTGSGDSYVNNSSQVTVTDSYLVASVEVEGDYALVGYDLSASPAPDQRTKVITLKESGSLYLDQIRHIGGNKVVLDADGRMHVVDFDSGLKSTIFPPGVTGKYFPQTFAVSDGYIYFGSGRGDKGIHRVQIPDQITGDDLQSELVLSRTHCGSFSGCYPVSLEEKVAFFGDSDLNGEEFYLLAKTQPAKPQFQAPAGFTGPTVTSITDNQELPTDSFGVAQQMVINGSNLGSVTEVLIGDVSLEIQEVSPNQIIAISNKETESNNLVVVSDSQKITTDFQLAVFSIETNTTESNFWTKRNGDNVKIYAKNIIGSGKVQFFVNGEEIAWVRAEDETDSKLRVITSGHMTGASYLVRDKDLLAGKNVFEIYVDGERVERRIASKD